MFGNDDINSCIVQCNGDEPVVVTDVKGRPREVLTDGTYLVVNVAAQGNVKGQH